MPPPGPRRQRPYPWRRRASGLADARADLHHEGAAPANSAHRRSAGVQRRPTPASPPRHPRVFFPIPPPGPRRQRPYPWRRLASGLADARADLLHEGAAPANSAHR